MGGLCRLVTLQLVSVCVSSAPLMEKLGAYAMQVGETSPVPWHGRLLLIEAVTGDTPGVYPCCNCTTFGCVNDPNATVGYADCSGCQCFPQRKIEVGSCAPEFFRIRDWQTLEVLVSPIPYTEGFGFAAAFAHGGRLWVYGTNLVNGTDKNRATMISCFSSADPTNPKGSWEMRRALTMPSGYYVWNTDAWAVSDPGSPDRRFIMSIETNVFTGSWTTIFAETSSETPDRHWKLLDPKSYVVDLTRMNACPSVRFFDGWYYIATTTSGHICPQAGWANSTALCVIVYRSQTLKAGSWEMGNSGKPIIFPGEDDRRVMAPWKPTAAEEAAIFGHAPQVLGDINNSDFDFCDSADGVLGLFAGIANQQSNPYFSIGSIARNQTSASWLASYFPEEQTNFV